MKKLPFLPAALAGLLLGSLLLLSGCVQAPQPLYYWGNFDSLTYTNLTAPQKAQPGEQIMLLQQDVQTARSRGQAVPPGLHAYLGYLYTRVGDSASARREFEAEKQAFPESAAFMDSLLAKLGPA